MMVENYNEWKQSWPNLTYYLSICLMGLRKAMKTLSRDDLSPSWKLKEECYPFTCDMWCSLNVLLSYDDTGSSSMNHKDKDMRLCCRALYEAGFPLCKIRGMLCAVVFVHCFACYL
jgi:hypothetical protein